jgi:hypothetical protein
MRVARYNALRALNFICSNRVVIPERCRFFINPQSTKCRRYAVLMPGLKIFHACLTSPFRLNAHNFPNNIQSNPGAMLLFGRAPKFLYPILYPRFLHPIAISSISVSYPLDLSEFPGQLARASLTHHSGVNTNKAT